MFASLRSKTSLVYHEYPRQFWTLALVTFIDRLGGSLLYPFFALYLTRRFNIGMSEVGGLFAIFSLSSFFGVTIGGALTDRLGRRGMLIFSLVATSVTAVAMGLVNTMEAFTAVALVVGILTDAGGPAYNAAVADLLPEEKRAQGFGVLRVVFNLAVAIGPLIGGLLARNSYLLLFLADAVISLVCALLIFRYFPETKPQPLPGEPPSESVGKTFGGYGRVFRDWAFMLFSFASMLMAFVYMNMNTTLGVYLRDNHQVSEASYGLILSLNAALVVLFQFPITRRIEKLRPMPILAVGSLLYAIGFGMYGVVQVYALFLVAMVIITLGEMLISPVSSAVVARLAPEDMRGRYNAVYSYSWGIAFAFGPMLAGNLMDRANPDLLWLAAFVLAILSALGFAALSRKIP